MTFRTCQMIGEISPERQYFSLTGSRPSCSYYWCKHVSLQLWHSPNLGLNPEPHSPLTSCACVFTNSAWPSPHVACNLLLLILFKHVLWQQFSPSVHLYKTRGWFVPNLTDIKLQASLTCPYILMRPWSHSFTSWFTLQSSKVLNQGDFKPLLQDLQMRCDKLFISLACCSFQPQTPFSSSVLH